RQRPGPWQAIQRPVAHARAAPRADAQPTAAPTARLRNPPRAPTFRAGVSAIQAVTDFAPCAKLSRHARRGESRDEALFFLTNFVLRFGWVASATQRGTNPSLTKAPRSRERSAKPRISLPACRSSLVDCRTTGQEEGIPVCLLSPTAIFNRHSAITKGDCRAAER